MKLTRHGIVFGTLATVIAIGLTAVNAQNTTGGQQPPQQREGRPGPGRFGGPGGPWGPGRGGPGGPMGLLGPILGRLDLTESQHEQVRTIVDSRREEMKGVADRAMAARDALHAAVTADTFDESAIRAKSAELSSVEADVQVMQARVYADVLQILTPEQRAQAKQLQSEMKDRRGGRGRGGPGGRGGQRPPGPPQPPQ